MSLLYPFYRAVSALPIADPYAGYEGELVASGAKPIAEITEWPAGWNVRGSARDDAQRAIADSAAARGKILKYKLVVDPPNIWGNEDRVITHFYCQPQFLDDMMELVECYRQFQNTGEMGPISRDAGYFFGCTDSDFRHPAAPSLAGKFLHAISPFTRYCRARTLLHEAAAGTIRLRTRPDTA